jgi:hypothetical protein
MIFRRKKKRTSVEVKHIPLPILIRQTIYDTMLEPAEGIAEAMGLPPISDEVADMEADASQERLESIARLLPFIESHSDIASRIAAAAYALDDDMDVENILNLSEEDYEKIYSLFKIVAMSSSISCISTLVNLGLVESTVSYGK